MDDTAYLNHILNCYRPKDLSLYSRSIADLKAQLKSWAGDCYININESGSYAKGTATSLSSDVDFLISLTHDCNDNSGGLATIYFSLYSKLSGLYQARQQNVSVRINLNGLNVDVTPAKKQLGNTNDHSLYVSKQSTWKQTNIQKHINDVSQSSRTKEIKLIKIWRDLNKFEFPSIYLEYLVIKRILSGQLSGDAVLLKNFIYILQELARDDNQNPLFTSLTDPASSTNNFSNLLTQDQKWSIIFNAKSALNQQGLPQILY
ncbi:MAG: hypothetical protein RLZZ361_32 [Cyanobacteriota bacterium]|jgi:hypothetical protein